LPENSISVPRSDTFQLSPVGLSNHRLTDTTGCEKARLGVPSVAEDASVLPGTAAPVTVASRAPYKRT